MSTLVLCTLLGCPAAVAAAQDPAYGDVAELHYSPSEGPPGTRIAITGRCLYEGRPADRAFVSLYDEPPTRNVASVSIPISADGSVHGSLLVPTSEPPGQHQLSGFCVKDDFTIGANITGAFRVTDAAPITAPPATRPPTTVATTTTVTTTTTTTTPPTTTTAPTTTVTATRPASSNTANRALPALAAAGAIAGGAALLARRQRQRT